MNKLLYQQHVMWYESNMLNETLDSLHNAIKYSDLPVDINICLNSQTYLEKPIEGSSSDMFDIFIDHPVLRIAKITYKTDDDEFYNVGDWRREVYHNDYKYTIWGESDCLIPEDYFYILSNLDIQTPHIVSCASRIMWDDTWTIVEHEDLQKYPNLNNQIPTHEELAPFRYYDCISLQELNDFNNRYDITIKQLPFCKVDGSLLALSNNLPTPFIAHDLHFVREDTCAEMFFQKKQIPQFCITTRIKGHNYYHPKKRMNTMSSRNDSEYISMAQNSNSIISKFLYDA